MQTSSAVPRLSIIIATFNAARTLERALDSVVGQSFTDWELLVADGGSGDGTQDILQRYQDHLAWWQSRPDGGIYDAWNQALEHARGTYVCFLGADDAWMSPQTLEQLFAAINGQDFDLVTSVGKVVDPASGNSTLHGAAWNYARLGRRIIVCHPGLLHRRELFERFGKFDASFRIAGDMDFLLRLPADIRTLHVDQVSVMIEAAGISKTQVMRRLLEQRRALSRCPRYGVARAYLVWFDKLWRYPIARLFGIPH